MATDQTFLAYIRDQLSGLDGVTFRPMMGEYILYLHGRIAGGIYDDRLLVKPVDAACRMLPDAPRELPYPGAKEMLLVEETDSPDFLEALLTAMYPELPEPNPRKKRS